MKDNVLRQGDSVFVYGGAEASVDCIAMRQRRGMCARLSFGDGSGLWVEVERIKPLTGLLRAFEVQEDDH